MTSTAYSSGVLFTHTCDVSRNTGTADSWNEVGPTWTAHLAGQACRGWTNTGTDVVAVGKVVTFEERMVEMPLGTDVTTLDQVGDVTDEYGTLILGGPHIVETVLKFADRLQLSLRKVGAAA